MATLASVRTAPLAIPAFRRREPEPAAPEPGAPSSPDLLFSMSPEPEPGFHTRMIQQQGLGSTAALPRDPSLEALFARPSPIRSRTSIASAASRSPLGVAVRPPAARSISALPQEEQPWLYSFPTPTRTGVSLPYHTHAYRHGTPAVEISASPPMVVRSHPRRFERAGGASHSKPAHPGPPTRSSTSSSSSASSSGFSSPPRDSSTATSVATSRDLSPPTHEKHSSTETVCSRLCDALTHDVRLSVTPSRCRAEPAAAKRRPMHAQALLAGSPAAPRVSMDYASSYKPDEGLMRKTPGSPLATCIDPMQARGRRRPAVP